MCIYRDIIRPLLFQLDPEQSHNLAHKFISHGTPVLAAMSGQYIYPDNDLQVSIFGKTLSNPIGLAAGFDKNGDLVHALKYLGFGYAEIGSITAQAHEGNPKPRLWRLPADHALINWLGLNNQGAANIAQKLAASNFSIPIGITIAKTNKPNITGPLAYEDMLTSFRAIRHLPILYVAVNVSCPNTVDSILEETETLSSVIEQIKKENPANLPILLKLSPDSDNRLIEEVMAMGKKFSLGGYICSNTSITRAGLKTTYAKDIKNGGLSGPPLKALSLILCRRIYEMKEPNQVIIGCGGISNGQDAYDFIRAGSIALQLYTALVYKGPSVVRKICRELSALLKRDGLTLTKAIGIDCSSRIVGKS
jgi:dihydroorotate dehydrogenase